MFRIIKATFQIIKTMSPVIGITSQIIKAISPVIGITSRIICQKELRKQGSQQLIRPWDLPVHEVVEIIAVVPEVVVVAEEDNQLYLFYT
jgi:hypothetical protein